MRGTLILFLSILSLFAGAQQRTCVAFWNVENLYDTIPSLFYDDSEYTPGGLRGWDSTRYTAKLCSLARVIDEICPDVLGLAEVESEQAVRDLVMTLKTDYNYIHRTTRDSRGMDVAMLYKGDKFIPERVRQVDTRSRRQALWVQGELLGERVDLVVCHMPSMMNTRHQRETAMKALGRFADSLQRSDPHSRLLIMGDMNADPREKIMCRAFATHTGTSLIKNPFAELYAKGYGSYTYRGKRHVYDNILVGAGLLSGPLTFAEAGIFIKEYLITADDTHGRRGYPLRTFVGVTYTAGYSDHLPVYVFLRVNK